MSGPQNGAALAFSAGKERKDIRVWISECHWNNYDTI